MFFKVTARVSATVAAGLVALTLGLGIAAGNAAQASPDQATTMTAIALAESGGDTSANDQPGTALGRDDGRVQEIRLTAGY